MLGRYGTRIKKFFILFFSLSRLGLGSGKIDTRNEIFFLFYGLSRLGLAINEARMTFFLIFFLVF